jgi:hypothetical protein
LIFQVIQAETCAAEYLYLQFPTRLINQRVLDGFLLRALPIQTGYPGSATLTLLRRLPSVLEFRHFSDSDSGGETLRVLTQKSRRDFVS